MTSYQHALAITSQFPFCSIPFRLDSFSECQFSCRYCFASSRGGFTGERHIRVAEPTLLDRRLCFLASNEPRSIIDELLAARVPLHFGGMSDPFMPMERRTRTTLAFLRVLQKHRYPTIISTKSTLCAEAPYIQLLSSGSFHIQVSIPIAADSLGRVLDAGAPAPSARFNLLSALRRAGIRTTCRIQPILPTYEHEAFKIVKLATDAGAQHLAFEYLKLPIEANSPVVRRLVASLGHDFVANYRTLHSTRIGREWVLPANVRLPHILELRRAVWSSGLTFGAADNDLLPLSDGYSCCSGADLLGFDTTYRFTYTQAVHAAKQGVIRFSDIAHEWRPTRTIQRFINSRSRYKSSSVEEYIRTRWNGRNNGPSPEMFYGINRTPDYDDAGLSIYRITDALAPLLRERPQSTRARTGPVAR